MQEECYGERDRVCESPGKTRYTSMQTRQQLTMHPQPRVCKSSLATALQQLACALGTPSLCTRARACGYIAPSGLPRWRPAISICSATDAALAVTASHCASAGGSCQWVGLWRVRRRDKIVVSARLRRTMPLDSMTHAGRLRLAAAPAQAAPARLRGRDIQRS